MPCLAHWPCIPLAYSLALWAELRAPESWAGAISEGMPGSSPPEEGKRQVQLTPFHKQGGSGVGDRPRPHGQ